MAAGADTCRKAVVGFWPVGEVEMLESWTSWQKESVDAPRLVQIPSPVQVL